MIRCASQRTGTLNSQTVPSCAILKESKNGGFTMYDELWSEIADAPGEIFDLPEMREFAEEIDPENVIGYDDNSFDRALDSNYDF